MEPELEQTRELILRARTGDRAAFEQLLRTYRSELVRGFHGRVPAELRGRVDVSDVVQDTLVDVVHHFDAFEYQGKGSFQRWLARVAANRMRKTLRYHSTRKRSAGREKRASSTAGESPSAASPSDAAAAQEERERLEAILSTLAPDYQEVIRRTRIEGRSLDEVARAMGRSPNAVKHLLARALKKIGVALGGEGERGADRKREPP